jgi:para-aminobenzoate synthetase/4-amino-4-deoxychorismate lyase
MTVRTPFVLLDDARPGRDRLLSFRRPAGTIRAEAPEEVPAALAAMERARADGRHLAGYLSYELGLLLEPRLAPRLPETRAVPLLWFGVFEPPEILEGAAALAALDERIAGRAYAGPLRHEWDEPAYAARFARVHDWIAAGDIYQANLSFRSRFAFAGDAMALYRDLRARAGAAHCAYIDDGTHRILSLSPELFFDISADGALTAKPMKGTAARGHDRASDDALRAWLAASEKDRAENLMIVDLLRNDLGRVAETGSVAVKDLFAVETYPTVHQMVSTVTATLRPGTGVAAILKALFPCGSITGAPKIRAMEIIDTLEDSPRGVYCGAIGYFAPDGSANFNVAIRTLTIADGHGELGIGGAVVYDSTAPSEYDECLVKARYYEAARKPLELIETLRYAPGEGFTRLERHLARMASSAPVFGLAFDRARALRNLQSAVFGAAGPMRVRLTLNEAGEFATTAAPLPDAAPARWTYAISPERVTSTDLLLRHKTNWRELYEREHAGLAAQTGCDEVLFLNERGALTEGSRTNLFAEIDGALATPPLTAGVLDGCLRREMLDAGDCIERPLTPADLARAGRIFLGNSLRGLISASPAQSV